MLHKITSEHDANESWLHNTIAREGLRWFRAGAKSPPDREEMGRAQAALWRACSDLDAFLGKAAEAEVVRLTAALRGEEAGDE